MKRTIEFGKVDWNNTGRKRNLITLDVELKDDKLGPVFTVVGNVWNSIKSDIVCGGQCLDQLLPYCEWSELFLEIYRYWKAYHLNDLHAGTPKQEAFLKTWNEQNLPYADRVIVLQNAGIYEDYDAPLEYCNGGKYWDPEKQKYYYKYGHGWVYFPIPALDLERIKQIIEPLKED